jgi:hypothetical protein
MERHIKNCRVHLDRASTAINNNINRDHVIIDPSSPPPLNIEPSSSSPPVAAPGESSVDNPEPPLTVISRGCGKKRGTKSNDEEEKRTSDANEVRGGIKSGGTISLLGSSRAVRGMEEGRGNGRGEERKPNSTQWRRTMRMRMIRGFFVVKVGYYILGYYILLSSYIK